MNINTNTTLNKIVQKVLHSQHQETVKFNSLFFYFLLEDRLQIIADQQPYRKFIIYHDNENSIQLFEDNFGSKNFVSV